MSDQQRAELNKRFDDIFGDGNADEDVSLESALAANQKPATETVTVEVYDTELGFVTEEITVTPVKPEVSNGDFVTVKAHTVYGDLRGGAVHSTMHKHTHHGYSRVKVHSIAADGSVEVELSNGDVDIVDIQYCEKL